MATHLQTVALLDKIQPQSKTPLRWSLHEPNYFAVIIQSGIYVVKLTAVPTNTSQYLNFFPKLLPNDPDKEILEIEWLPNNLIMCLTKAGDLFVKSVDHNDVVIEVDENKVKSFAVYENFIVNILQDRFSIHKLDLENLSSTYLCSNRTKEKIATVAVSSIASSKIVFVGLQNGLVKAYKFDESSPLQELSGNVWEDQDFLSAKYMMEIRNDFIENRTVTILFVKATYIVISEVDFSHPALETISVKRQQCLQIINQNIINVIESKPGKEYLVGIEHGPTYLLKVPQNLEEECEIEPIDQTDFDRMKYRVQTFQGSKNNAILTQAQVSLHSKDEVRLIFFTNDEMGELLNSLVNDKKLSELYPITDVLEVLRLQLISSQEVVQDLHEKLAGLKKPTPFHFWISTVLASLHSAPGTWDKLSNEIASKLISMHAADSKIKVDKNASKWICRTCNSSGSKDQPYLDVLKCQNDHKWPRCCLSLEVCQSVTLAQCSWCGAVAKPQYHKSFCTLCSGMLLIS